LAKRKKQKKYLLKPRFFCLIFSILLIGGVSYHLLTSNQENELPNFYGWLAEDVMEFAKVRDNISIIYELDYSETVPPTRVISQSLHPGTELGSEPVVLTVRVSKGLPLNN